RSMNEATPLEYLGYQGNPENNQAVFGFVARHLLRQQAKSSAAIAGREETLCVFRSPGGLMCAAGCLVPDADYDPQWEHDGEIGGADPSGTTVVRHITSSGAASTFSCSAICNGSTTWPKSTNGQRSSRVSLVTGAYA